jgi:hypothetical protein
VVELVFEAPHPFDETFKEEEVIADRYAAAPLPALEPKAAEPAPANEFKTITAERDEYAAVARASESKPVSKSRVEPQSDTIPMPQDRKAAWKDGPQPEVAAATIAAVAEEPPSRPRRSVVPPPRQQFGRLFAKLRRGL